MAQGQTEIIKSSKRVSALVLICVALGAVILPPAISRFTQPSSASSIPLWVYGVEHLVTATINFCSYAQEQVLTIFRNTTKAKHMKKVYTLAMSLVLAATLSFAVSGINLKVATSSPVKEQLSDEASKNIVGKGCSAEVIADAHFIFLFVSPGMAAYYLYKNC
jgi:hypothetical protein